MSKTVLIIEDDHQLNEVLATKFTHEGFEVLTAGNGQEGLSMALEKEPDMILLDIVMPKMDGLEVLERLRQDSWGKTAEVIVLSNLGDLDHVSTCTKHRVHDYLVKTDWEVDEVVKKVKAKLNIK